MQSTSEPGQVIAFYSFKGGTGRSMALANVGCTLAQMPELSKPILLIDWDLEAPGLHRYFRKHLFQAFDGSEQIQEESPGLIDLFIELRDQLDQVDAVEPQEIESAVTMLAELAVGDYIVETDIPRLHLLKAGRFDKGYAERISTFNWPALYRKSPYLLKAFAARLAQDYRYVLIDSRTGLTDTSSICTMLLPEILVTVFTPNRQSLAGVVDLIVDAGRYRLQSEDVRPLVIYPLPSRIEASEPGLRQQWRHGDAKAGIEGFQDLFEKAFAEIYALPACDLAGYFDDVQIQHAPRYAYGEELAVLVEESRDRFSLTRSFQRFAARLVEGHPPWTPSEDSRSIASDQSPAIDDELAKSAGEDASRRREAAAYLQRIEESTNGFKKSLSRFVLAEKLSFYLEAAGLSVLVALVYSFGASGVLPILLIAPLWGVASSAVSRVLSTRKEKLDSSVAIIANELQSFKEGLPPYDTSAALNRLRGHIDPIILSLGSDSQRLDRKRMGDGKIFICYRRSDIAIASRLYDRLSKRFGVDRVFMDIDSIPLGTDFVAALSEMVKSASVMLVIIGPTWTREMRVANARFGSGRDFVKAEISIALRNEVPTIPLLIERAGFPSAVELPDDIRGLADRNGLELSHARFHADVERLVRALERIVR